MMISDIMPSVFICSPCPKGSTTFPKSATSWDLMFKHQAVGNSSHSHVGRFPTLVSLNSSTCSLDSLASCAQGLLWKLAPSWGSIPSPPLLQSLLSSSLAALLLHPSYSGGPHCQATACPCDSGQLSICAPLLLLPLEAINISPLISAAT